MCCIGSQVYMCCMGSQVYRCVIWVVRCIDVRCIDVLWISR